MKKRLLSAALALAMVLTMLPLTAFAADPAKTDPDNSGSKPGNASTAVSIDATGNASWSYKDADGKTQKAENKSLSSGVIAASRSNKGAAFSGTYYTDFESAMKLSTNTSFILLGNVNNASSLLTRNITVDLNGHDFAVGTFDTTAGSTDASKSVNQLTFKNLNATLAGKVTGDISVSGKSFTLSLTNVGNGAGGLDVTLDNAATPAKSQYTLKVTAIDSELGNIVARNANVNVSLTKGSAGDIQVLEGGTGTTANIGNEYTDGNTVTLDGATVANIQINGYSGNSTVTLKGRAKVTGTSAGTVTLYGQNTLNVNGMSEISGDTTLFGAKDDSDGKDDKKIPSWKTTVTVDGTSTMGAITQADDDENGHKIDIKGGSTVAGIDVSKGGTSDIDINGSKLGATGTGTLAIARGSVDIKNSGMDNIVAGKDGETGGVAVTIGTQNQADTSKVGDVTKATGTSVATPAVKLYSGAVGDISGTSHEVYGGTTGSKVEKANLKNGLADGYQIALGATGKETYAYTTNFQDLIDKYGAEANPANTFKATRVNDDPATGGKTVTFQWTKDSSAQVLTKLTVTASTFVTLPSKVNGTTVNYWYDKTKGDGMSPVDNPFMVAGDVILVAQLSDKVDKMVTGVKAVDTGNADQPIDAILSGNTINLSGAVKTVSTTGSIKLSFEVDGSYATTVQSVNVGWDSATGKIVLSGKDGDGVTLPTLQSNQVKVYDTIYTITGTGLKAMVSKVKIGDLENGVIVVPHTSAGMSGSFTELGKDMKTNFENKDKSNVGFSGAAGLKAALNALIAGLSQNSVDSYINQARTAMVQYNNRNKVDNRTNWAAAEFASYDTLVLTPYLEISSNNPTITGDGSNTILTLTITLKARYTVVESASSAKVAYKDKTTVNGEVVEVPWETAASINAGEDCGQVDIQLTMPGADTTLTFTSSSYAHHDGQVFEIEWGTTTDGQGTIACTNGFVNKTFVINNTKPIAAVGAYTGTGSAFVARATFDNLQDAVDAVKNSETIEVSDNFNGAITVTGAARKFTIKAVDNKTVTLTAVNGANVTSEFKASSKEYEIQLSADNFTNARITVGTANNGTAAVNMTSARQGSTVTITVNPSSGYRPLAPTVRTNTGAAVSVTAGTNNTYTFVVPDGATSITVTPSFVQNTGLPFNDVAANAWYFDGVAYCYNNNLMQGYDGAATTFGINHAVTRAEVVTILWRLAGQPIETPRTTYTDVKSGEWHYNAISWATNHGYAKGYGDGRFGPNNPVQRQELVVFLHRYAGEPTVNSNLGAYSDGGGVESWAMAAMRWATSYSILSGTNSVSLNGRLNAYSTAYREQVAVTLQHYHQYYK